MMPLTLSTHQKKICCYARLKDEAIFELHDFYRTDIQIFRQLGYDVVVTNSIITMLRTRCDIYFAWWFGYGLFAALLGFFRRKPVIVSGVIHTLNCGGLSAWPFLKRNLIKLTMKLADHSIVCSQGEHDRLEGFRPRDCKIIPLSIDSDVYRFKPQVREKVILMITQLNLENIERKMVLPAITAFAEFSRQHPDFSLIICGTMGDGMDTVRAHVRKLELDRYVTFTDRVSMPKKVSLLQSAWAYLQPTSCEGFGLAIGEALACGTPVVTSPEVCVVGTYGNAVQYGETTAELAQALSSLVENAALYSTMQDRGLLQVQKYSLANRRSQYQNLLNHVQGNCEARPV